MKQSSWLFILFFVIFPSLCLSQNNETSYYVSSNGSLWIFLETNQRKIGSINLKENKNGRVSLVYFFANAI
jgi:hypothetical protein